jgi:hypothetical protein
MRAPGDHDPQCVDDGAASGALDFGRGVGQAEPDAPVREPPREGDLRHDYPSIVALVAVVETLLATVVAKSDQGTLNRIKQIETLRERSGAYLR